MHFVFPLHLYINDKLSQFYLAKVGFLKLDMFTVLKLRMLDTNCVSNFNAHVLYILSVALWATRKVYIYIFHKRVAY